MLFENVATNIDAKICHAMWIESDRIGSDRYIGDTSSFGRKISMLEHTGVVLSVAHVRPLSKISLESGKVAGSQRYSFHEGK